MKSPQVVKAKLEVRTDADCSADEIKNNKVHYHLKYESSRGWDWLEKQVYKTSEDLDIELELYQINTSGVSSFEVEVRELCQRENVRDENQQGLGEFEP
jgi:hypothetical protein